MMDLFLLAQEAAAAPTGASGIDWAGVAMAITALGGLITAVLQGLGKAKAAAQAKKATESATAMVRGVEAADKALKAQDYRALASSLKTATGVDLTPDQIAAAAKVYNGHVKKSIKETAMAMDVESLIADLVEKHTTRLSSSELQKRLEEEKS